MSNTTPTIETTAEGYKATKANGQTATFDDFFTAACWVEQDDETTAKIAHAQKMRTYWLGQAARLDQLGRRSAARKCRQSARIWTGALRDYTIQ